MRTKINGLVMSALVLSIGFTSCLKDDNIDDQKYGLIDLNANKIIEIPTNASHEKSLTLLPAGLTEINIGTVRLAAENAASENIVVSLTTANSSEIITDEEKELFPLEGIIVPATVTIPKGERSAPIVVQLNTALLKSNPQYVAVSISAVDKDGYVISGNFGNVILNMKVKHKYEGRYILTGTMEHLPNPALYMHISNLPDFEEYTVQLQTVDGSTLIFYDELVREDYLYPMMTAAGAASAWGSFCPRFTFDTEGNITAVTNDYGQPASNTRSAVLDPTGVNKYDEATKTFSVSYYMVQPSVVTTAPYYRVHFVETYKFKEDL